LTGLGEEVLKNFLPLPNFEVTPLGSSPKGRFFILTQKTKSPESYIVVAYSVGLLIRRRNVTKTSTGGPPHSHKPLAQRVLIVAAETWFLLTG